MSRNSLRKSAHSACTSPQLGKRRTSSLSASGTRMAMPLFVGGTDSNRAHEDDVDEWSTRMSMQALHELGVSPRLAPLARFSASGQLSPANSPRNSTDFEAGNSPPRPPLLEAIPEDKAIHSNTFLRTSQRKLKKLLSPRSEKPSTQANDTTGVSPVRTSAPLKKKKKNKAKLSKSTEQRLHRKLLSRTDVGDLPRAHSLPCSPRQLAKSGVVMMAVKRVVDDDALFVRSKSAPNSPRITRGRSNTIAEDVLPQAVVDHFAQSMRSFESSGMSTDDSSVATTTDSASDSSASLSKSGRSLSAKQQKKRHSAYLKATSGGSPKHGVSATLDFDERTNEPIVRVRSHSSVDELKRRLVAESGNEAVDTVFANHRSTSGHMPPPAAGRSSSSDESTADSASGSGGVRGILRTVSGRRRRNSLTNSTKLTETYTEIMYNSCPIGSGAWWRYLVPNSVMNPALHTHLARATASNKIDDPFRLCHCQPNCREHVPPDASAKLFAVYLVDPNVLVTKTLQPILVSAVAAYRATHAYIAKGAWNSLYRVSHNRKLDPGPITDEYKFCGFV